MSGDLFLGRSQSRPAIAENSLISRASMLLAANNRTSPFKKNKIEPAELNEILFLDNALGACIDDAPQGIDVR